MKFAHISDTHLGFSQFGTGERAKDVYNAFLQAIDISIKEKVEFVVFAGDIFHTPTPDGTAIINMAHALKKLQDVSNRCIFFYMHSIAILHHDHLLQSFLELHQCGQLRGLTHCPTKSASPTFNDPSCFTRLIDSAAAAT